jgi:hypothetical protein
MDLSLSGQSRGAVGRLPAASPVLAPGAALGSRPRVALSSAQVLQVYFRTPGGSIHFSPDRPFWEYFAFLCAWAAPSLCFRSDQICSSLPASLSAGVM